MPLAAVIVQITITMEAYELSVTAVFYPIDTYTEVLSTTVAQSLSETK